jgi:hypothetical protein
MATGQLPSTLSPSYKLMVRRPSSNRMRRVLLSAAVLGAGRLRDVGVEPGVIPLEAVFGRVTGRAGVLPGAWAAGRGGRAGGASTA